mmetsp:Transcript_29283/g.75465  ORF Transcript_29283/g.75465 Transcript_29283/m.75465 type:complete len:209 (-) Transcript_29283:248-874(-)
MYVTFELHLTCGLIGGSKVLVLYCRPVIMQHAVWDGKQIVVDDDLVAENGMAAGHLAVILAESIPICHQAAESPRKLTIVHHTIAVLIASQEQLVELFRRQLQVPCKAGLEQLRGVKLLTAVRVNLAERLVEVPELHVSVVFHRRPGLAAHQCVHFDGWFRGMCKGLSKSILGHKRVYAGPIMLRKALHAFCGCRGTRHHRLVGTRRR